MYNGESGPNRPGKKSQRGRREGIEGWRPPKGTKMAKTGRKGSNKGRACVVKPAKKGPPGHRDA